MKKRLELLGQGRRLQTMKTRWADGMIATNAYRERLARLVKPGMRILHAGCGWDKNEVSRPFKNFCTVVGVDLDPRVQSKFHSEFHLGSLEKLPFASESFDLVFCEYVFEHLENPEQVLSELKRVLKPNGAILVLTPNFYSYKTLSAHLTPQRFHVAMGRHRYGPGHEADMYPTLYRCNTEESFYRLSHNAGLRINHLELLTNGPTWFQKIPGVFGAFHLFHLAVRRWTFLRQLRCAILVELTKA